VQVKEPSIVSIRLLWNERKEMPKLDLKEDKSNTRGKRFKVGY
jgi:hypothetical protein